MFSALVKVTEEELMACKSGDRIQSASSQFNANQHEDISHKVVALLKANPTLKGYDQQRVANALFISPRTLQRKLKQSGTSFQQILNSERKARLDDLLKHHSIADTADLWGFRNNHHYHAFKSGTQQHH